MNMRSQIKALTTTAWIMRQHITSRHERLLILLLMLAPGCIALFFSPTIALRTVIMEAPVCALLYWCAQMHGLILQWHHRGEMLVPGHRTTLHAAFGLLWLFCCSLCSGSVLAFLAWHVPLQWSLLKQALLVGFGVYGVLITSIALGYRYRKIVALTYLVVLFGIAPWLARHTSGNGLATILNALVDWAPVTCLAVAIACLTCAKHLIFPLQSSTTYPTSSVQRRGVDWAALTQEFIGRCAARSMGRITHHQTRGMRPIILALAPAMSYRHAIGALVILGLPHLTFMLINLVSAGVANVNAALSPLWPMAFCAAWASLTVRCVWLRSTLSETDAERKLLLLTPNTPPAQTLDAHIRRYFLIQYACVGTLLFALQGSYFGLIAESPPLSEAMYPFAAGALLGPAAIIYSCHAQRIAQGKRSLRGHYGLAQGGYWLIFAVIGLLVFLSQAYDMTPSTILAIGAVIGALACYPAYRLALHGRQTIALAPGR